MQKSANFITENFTILHMAVDNYCRAQVYRLAKNGYA